MNRRVFKTALRGAAGFTGGAAVGAALAAWYLITTSAHTEATAPHGATPLALLGLFLSGAIGAVVVLWGKAGSREILRAGFLFGIGLSIAPVIAFICSAIGFNHETMRTSFPWTIIGFAAGYGIGGAIGGSALGPRYATLGMVAFGIGGALAGGFHAVSSYFGAGGIIGSAVSVFLPYVVGGALFAVFTASDDNIASTR